MFLFFEARFLKVQVGLKFLILLPLCPGYWNSKLVLPHPAKTVDFKEVSATALWPVANKTSNHRQNSRAFCWGSVSTQASILCGELAVLC